MTERIRYSLESKYSTQRSFGYKADVEDSDDGSKTLYNYNTRIVTIYPNKSFMLHSTDKGHYSATTIRHMSEFFQQNGLKALNKKTVMAMLEAHDHVRSL